MRLDFFRDRLMAKIEGTVSDHFLRHGDYFGDLGMARNAVDFAASEEFLDIPGIYENKGQYLVLRDYFGLRCPDCNKGDGDVFRRSVGELREEILLEWDSDAVDFICPGCGVKQADLILRGNVKRNDTLLGVIGMKGGKTMLASIIMSYFEHFLIKQGDLRKYFGLPKAPFVEITAVAVSGEQAKQTIWAQYIANRKLSLWYKKLDEIVKDNRFDKLKLYNETTVMIYNDIVHLLIQPANSSSATLAGKAKVLYVMEELGRFDTTESKRSAKEIWGVGQSSLKPVRQAVKKLGLPFWLGSFVGIGSPISVDDYGMMKTRSLVGKPDSGIMALRYATWDFNKNYEKSDFAEDYANDAVMAERDFGANPVGSETPWIDNFDLFLSAIGSAEALVEFADEEIVDGEVTYLNKVITKLSSDEYVHYICGDAGKSKDTFGLASVHMEDRVVNGVGEVVTVVDFVLHVLPNAGLKRLVWFDGIVEIIKRLGLVWNIGEVSFDYWDTDYIVQELRVNGGINVHQYQMSSLRVTDFIKFRQDVYRHRVVLLKPAGDIDGDASKMDSGTRFFWESKRMERSKDLRRIDHGTKSTSDIVECVVNCHRLVGLHSSMAGMDMGKVSGKGEILRREQASELLDYGEIAHYRRW